MTSLITGTTMAIASWYQQSCLSNISLLSPTTTPRVLQASVGWRHWAELSNSGYCDVSLLSWTLILHETGSVLLLAAWADTAWLPAHTTHWHCCLSCLGCHSAVSFISADLHTQHTTPTNNISPAACCPAAATSSLLKSILELLTLHHYTSSWSYLCFPWILDCCLTMVYNSSALLWIAHSAQGCMDTMYQHCLVPSHYCTALLPSYLRSLNVGHPTFLALAQLCGLQAAKYVIFRCWKHFLSRHIAAAAANLSCVWTIAGVTQAPIYLPPSLMKVFITSRVSLHVGHIESVFPTPTAKSYNVPAGHVLLCYWLLSTACNAENARSGMWLIDWQCKCKILSEYLHLFLLSWVDQPVAGEVTTVSHW